MYKFQDLYTQTRFQDKGDDYSTAGRRLGAAWLLSRISSLTSNSYSQTSCARSILLHAAHDLRLRLHQEKRENNHDVPSETHDLFNLGEQTLQRDGRWVYV